MITNRIPDDRFSRWQLVSALISSWYGDVLRPVDIGATRAAIADAEARLGFALPASLREWHLHSGECTEVWNVQDRLIPLRELYVEEDQLVIYRENQGVVHWSIPISELALPDPPVFASDPEGGTLHFEEAPSVSAFALQMLCLNAKFSYLPLARANGQVTEQAILAIEQNLSRLPFSDLHWPPLPTRLYGNDDVVVEIDCLCWIWITSRNDDVFSRLARLVQDSGVDLDFN